jgi:hypothetical protein
MKRCSTPLANGDMQITSRMRPPLISRRMLIIKNWEITFGKDVEKLELSYTVDRNVKWNSCFVKQFGTSSKS